MDEQGIRRFWGLSRDLMCVATTEGHFLEVNPRFTEVLGWSQKELTTRPFMDLVHPDDVAATMAEIARLAEGVPTIRFEDRFATKDGGWVWLEWTAQPEGDRLYASARDITRRKEAQEMTKARWKAEARADAMAAVARQQRIIINAAAHELQTPLTPLKLKLATLKHVVDAPDERKAVDQMEKSLDRLEATITALVDVSQMATEQLQLREGPTMLHALLASALDDAGSKADLRCPPDLEVHINPGLLARAVGALVDNAELHGGGAEEVRAEQKGDKVRIEVRDDGPGFAGDAGEQWSLPLYRGDDTQTRPGVGLGLTLVRLIAAGYAGEAGVRSDGPGKGTTAWIELPAA